MMVKRIFIGKVINGYFTFASDKGFTKNFPIEWEPWPSFLEEVPSWLPGWQLCLVGCSTKQLSLRCHEITEINQRRYCIISSSAKIPAKNWLKNRGPSDKIWNKLPPEYKFRHWYGVPQEDCLLPVTQFCSRMKKFV